ncbi:MAG: 3-mercaptopyruvate sulfurtransferase [Alphaproteobacteria bacterium]|nr:3-mercaptopyruvate sulfurtransferase [Alphaproteobacteria bacterium]
MRTVNAIIDQGVIEADELATLLADEETSVKVLDGSFALPGAAIPPYQAFLNKHIPGAQFFDIKEACDKSTDLPNMLPAPEMFENYVSSLGINNDDLIVIYGQTGIVMGPARVWWMMRVFGHDRVCILNGGLKAWESENLPTENTPPPRPEKTEFSANFRPELVVDIARVKDITADAENTVQLLDARPPGRFSGETPEPRPGMRSGHIPSSRNIPCITLVDQDTGKLKSADDLSTTLHESGLDYTKPIIATCGSGVTACVIALALFSLGHKDIPVYDGSWSEWGRESSQTEISTG